MSPREFVLGVDLDGVCANFLGGLRKIAAEWFGVPIDSLTKSVSYGLPEWGLEETEEYRRLHHFAVTQRDLFRVLDPNPNAPQVLRRLSSKGIRIRIITHRLYIEHFHREAVQQTIQWLDHHGIPYWDLCFMRDKTDVGADLYIEDSPVNIEKLRASGNKAIVLTDSTNLEIAEPRADNWLEVESLVLAEFEQWQKASDQ